jgi:hypothetical protein
MSHIDYGKVPTTSTRNWFDSAAFKFRVANVQFNCIRVSGGLDLHKRSLPSVSGRLSLPCYPTVSTIDLPTINLAWKRRQEFINPRFCTRSRRPLTVYRLQSTCRRNERLGNPIMSNNQSNVHCIDRPRCSRCGAFRRLDQLNGYDPLAPMGQKYRNAYCIQLADCDSTVSKAQLKALTEHME